MGVSVNAASRNVRWRGTRRRLAGTWFPARGTATVAHAVRKYRRDKCRIGDPLGSEGRAQINRVYQRDRLCAPTFTVLHGFVLWINRLSRPSNLFIGGVEKNDRNQFARLDELICAPINEFVQHCFKPILRNYAAET